jgi:hypothetical protein
MVFSHGIPINCRTQSRIVVCNVGGSGIVCFYCLCINAACGVMVIVMFNLSCMILILNILTLNYASHKTFLILLSNFITSYVILEQYLRIDLEVTWLIKSWNMLLVLYNLLEIFQNNCGYLIVLNCEIVVGDW